jgi:predicted alpha/beta superfamily hydrolase
MKFIYLLFIPILLSCSKDENLEIIGVIEEFSLQSNIINDSYPIYVYLPENYSNDSSNQLIIGLDGDTRFNAIANLISDKTQNGSMPPSILISIGNNKNRNRDYTPTSYDYGTGGANNFYQFISIYFTRIKVIWKNIITLMKSL